MANILVIDDDEAIRLSLKLLLESEGHVVTIAENGEKGLERLSKMLPDLILCDIVMPRLDGHQVLKALRGMPALAGIPFIFLSSLADHGDVRKGMGLGADDYLPKPFLANEVFDAVRSRIKRKDSITAQAEARDRLDLERTMRKFSDSNLPVAVLCIKLDRFAEIIAGLETASVRLLQKEFFDRLQGHFGNAERIFPIPGDAYFVILEADRPELALPVALTLLEKTRQPITLGTRVLHLTASIGIAHMPSQGTSLDDLIGLGRTAMAMSALEGGDCCRLALDDAEFSPHERLELESRLYVAAEQNEFTLNYQPQVSIATGKVTGVEALLRWTIPGRGPVPPGVFIRWAEENGSIVAIGEWVLREACRQFRAWQTGGITDLTISVNISGRQLRSQDIATSIAAIIKEEKMPPERLDLEVTESSLLRDKDGCVELLNDLRKTGIQLSLDDFGTGYSSLDYLQKLPCNRLKIDRSFVTGLPDSPDKKIIIESVVEMADGLGMTTLAEGVETAGELDFVKNAGCDEIQGYFFSRPLAADACTELLKGGKSLW